MTEYDGNGKAIPEHLTRLRRAAYAADDAFSAALQAHGLGRWSRTSGWPEAVREALAAKIRASAAWLDALEAANRQRQS